MVNSLWIAAFSVLGAGVLALELGISSAITELVAGLAVASFTDFQPDSYIEALGSLGLLTLMYIAGLEIDFDLVRSKLKSSLTIGLSSFLTSFIAVLVFTRYALGLTSEQSLLLGVALSTTSIAIVYPQLLLKGPLGEQRKGLLASAMITDLASMLALSFFFSNLTTVTLVLVVLLAALTYAVPKLGAKIFSRFKGNAVEFEFKIVLFIIISLAIVSEEAGIEAALVAFLAGMITSEVVVGHEDLQKKLGSIVLGFLAPIFFFWVGTTVNIWGILDNLVLLCVLLVICYSSKYVGTYIPCKKYFPKYAGMMGLLFNARLSLGLVAAIHGKESGILDESLYSAVVGCIILSSIVSSILLPKKRIAEDNQNG